MCRARAESGAYADITVLYKDLADQLGIFFKGLYSQALLDLAALRAKIGDIDGHYHQAFLPANKSGKCPFCGIHDIKGPHHTTREAYDHYLPKALYPFNSINFRNLAPACHECNSSYKLSKDPSHNNAGRRKAFYPYAPVGQTIELQLALQHADIANLEPANITLQFGPVAINEEIVTWKEVYGIEERYKAKICGENDGKAWLTQVLDEWTELGRNPADFLKAVALSARSRPYSDCAFLKKPFLDACENVGLFESQE